MQKENLLNKIARKSSNPEIVKRAFKFAEEAHQGQKRASGQEYIIHPLRVAEKLSEIKLDSETIAAGLLHDVVDDTQKTLEDIEKEFGKNIAFLVEGVSKLGKLRYPKEDAQTLPIEERGKEQIDPRTENLRKMFFAMAKDIRVILIKLADRMDNMETLKFLPKEKQKRIAMETVEIFAPIANRLGIGEVKGTLEDLSFPYLYPKEYQWIKDNLKERFKQRTKYLESLKLVLIKMLKKEGIKPIDIHLRAKHYWSLYQKLLKHDMDLGKIHDLIALRIIAKDVEECYKILGIIHKYWKPLPGRIKDYIATPKTNNYRAIHTTVFCVNGKITEIQIKTPEMHQEAEYGICAHWAQKERITPKARTRSFTWVSQLKDWQEKVTKSKDFWKGLKFDFFIKRIFVFTPKGEVIDLPENATPIDFAFAVHTEIGKHCAGVKINGKMQPLSSTLNNGDVVDIIKDSSKKPSRDWLEFAKTNLASSEIKNWLKKESRPERLAQGIKILDEQLKQIQGISWNKVPKKKKEELVQYFSLKDIESVLIAVGEGEISSKDVFKILFNEKEVFKKKKLLEMILPIKKEEAKVQIAGQSGIKVKLAKCCNPKLEDTIKAYITKNEGATIHKTDCKELEKIQEKYPQKIIEANWLIKKPLYKVTIKIKVKDQVGILRDIISVISSLDINIKSFSTKSQPVEEPAVINALIEVSGLEELDKLFGKLKQIKEIIEVKKI